MKAPRCRLCGKEHYGLCPSGSGIPASKSEGAGEQTGPGNVPGNQELVAQARNKHLVAKDGLTIQSAPLTAAQKQKAYRKRGGVELREREKLRKRAKRKNDMRC